MDKEDLKYIEAGILGCSESELTEDLSQEVDSEGNPLTKEQVEFFRNSKIRDSQGKLLVCYHGSKSHFTTFDKSKIKNGGWYGKGFYFTRSYEIADYYSEGHILTCYLNITNPFYADSSFTSKEEYHSRCNKLCELIGLTMEEIDKRDEECKYIGDPYYKLLLYLEHTKSTKDINDYVKELGYDGVIGLSPEDDSLEEFIILEPNQVKSIDNKNPSNKDDINEVLEEGKSGVTSKQNYQNQKAKRNIVKIAKDNQFDFALDTKELSVHHLDDTKDDNGLKNNSYSNLVFIRSKDFRDREVVHKLLHYMDRNNIDYDDLLKELENVKLYSYDEQNNKFIVKSLSSIREQLRESISQDTDSEGNPLTPEQVEFFKNSKIRDSKGRLLVVYHGTSCDFNKFDNNYSSKSGLFGDGFYFAKNKTLATNYGNKIITAYLNIARPFKYYAFDDEEVLAILNKYDENFDKDKVTNLLNDNRFNYDLDILDDIISKVIEKDPYGIIIKNVIDNPRGTAIPMDEIIAFYPNQIKSITNKTPSNSDNINEDWLSDANKIETIKQELNQAYDDLMGNDKTRLYRYREWANNSNKDYKEYIYNDLLNGKKEDALHYWYNHYKLFTGNYDLSYDDFLNTPITLYRATNVDEKDNATNPFFSYAQSKKLAQRFLDPTQRLHNKRTGEIEEIQIKPKDTLGMIPSDEDEIIVPNKAYQSRVNDMSSIVDNVIKYANDNNVKLPYDRDYILTLFNKRDKENVKKLEAQLMNYIDKRKGSKIKESVDNKTFTFPNLRQAIDFFWKDRNAKIETVPIKKLVDDNNLLNDWDLQSYHQRQWDNKKASEFSIDKGKVNSMRISEVPYAVRKKDGRLELGDGRHRTRALYNDGYEYVTLPVITESKVNESKTTPRIRESLLQEDLGQETKLIAYHCSKNKFNSFDLSKVNSGTNDGGVFGAGMYFTNNQEIAKSFGGDCGYLYKVELTFKNPYICNNEEDRDELAKLIKSKFVSKGDFGYNTNDMQDFFKLGYDSVISNNEKWNTGDSDYEYASQYVAFKDNQIKILEVYKYDLTVSLLQEGKQDIENFKKWIENNEDSNARFMSDGNKEAFINNWATEFNSIRQNLKSPYNDFYYWIKLNDWNAFTKFMQEQRNKKDAKQREKDGARLIYSDKDWKVYEITTYEASVKYGANTKWCISGSKRWSNGENGKGYWDDYTSKGVKFYFFIGKDTKYAIAIYPNGTDFEIFDAQDNSIAYIPNAPIIDEIKVDYYSQNEDRLMLNLIKTGQLPHVCSLLSSYLYDNDYYIDIFTKFDFDFFLQQIGEHINENYVKWLAVYDGFKDEEWYKQETGEEYEDEWWGDTTMYLQSDLGFLDGYATLDDALTKDNPYFDYDNCEYFIDDLYEGDIVCCKDWVAVWLSISNYIGDETDLINFVKEDIRDTWGYEDFEKVGLSKEYLQDVDESLDESLEDFDDEVGVVYHGGIEKSLHKDFRSILWFTEDYDYALDFGENIFICNLNLKNTFIVGNTDGYIRGLIPTQFSTDFTRLANNLKVTPKELLKCNPEAKNIYSIVRTKAFKELCIKNGYDSVETEEFGHVCFGVFNLDQVDIVDTDFEDESTLETLSPMDETLKPNLREELLLEKGTDYKKQAIKIISNSGLFDEETSTKIIEGLFRQDIHAFNHAPAWLEKYLKGIARMLVEYCDGDKSKAQQFLTECPSEFEYYLTWVKQNREKLGNQLDDEFVNNLTYEQVKEKNNKIRDEIDAKSKDELSKMKFSDSSNYTLVPIDSYEQMHKLYGGHWTGDGTDEEGEYAGNGGTSWCHTNSKNTYGSWVNNGKNKFFVLQRNDWKDIPFNEKTNKEMSGKDDYGNSLIAINTNRYGKLKYATLRCNHVGVDIGADNQYDTYAELSKLAGFNVEEEVKKYCEEPNENELPDGFYIDNGTLYSFGDNTDIESFVVPKDVTGIGSNTFYNCRQLTKITIPEGVTYIGDSAFQTCIQLTSIKLPNSLISIGNVAFANCSSLKSIEIPSNVTSIGYSAFYECTSLVSIDLPDSITSIGETTFSGCISLTNITIPNGVTTIEYETFENCTSLKKVTISNNVTRIGRSAFDTCTSLTSIILPNSLAHIGSAVFADCTSLTNIEIPSSVTRMGNGVFDGCNALASIVIPNSVTRIGFDTLHYCSPNLTVFTDNEYVENYCANYGINYAPLSEYHKA